MNKLLNFVFFVIAGGATLAFLFTKTPEEHKSTLYFLMAFEALVLLELNRLRNLIKEGKE